MQSKHREKFNSIYEKYSMLIYRISYAVLHNDEYAQDASQNCFLRIYKNMGYFQDIPSDDMEALISIVARNTAIDLNRKISRQSFREMEFKVELYLPSTESAIDEIIRKEDIGGLRKYANSLNPQHASIIALRFYYEYSFSQISSLLDITENNARVRLFRAKKKLANLITKGAIHHD